MKLLSDSGHRLQCVLLLLLLAVTSGSALAYTETYTIPGSFGMSSDNEDDCYQRRGVFFNGALYMFSSNHEEGSDWFRISMAKIEFDEAGKMSKYTQLPDLVNNNNTYRSYFVAPVVLNGKLFVFYDVREGSGKSWIAMKSTSNPVLGWDQPGNFLKGIRVVENRPDRRAPFTATSLGNQICLFYRVDNYLPEQRKNILLCSAVTPVGEIQETWTIEEEGQWKNTGIRNGGDAGFAEPDAMDSKTVLDDKGQTCIVLGWLYRTKSYSVAAIYLTPMDDQGKGADSTVIWKANQNNESGFEGIYDIQILEAALANEGETTAVNGFTVVLADARGREESQYHQVVPVNFIQWNLPDNRRWTQAGAARFFSIGTFSKSFDNGDVFSSETYSRSVCPFFSYRCPQGTKDLQQSFGIVFFHRRYSFVSQCAMLAYNCPNEKFAYKATQQLKTGDNAAKYKSLWSIVGVVEGVPPFQATNGEWESTVVFKEGTESNYTNSESWSGSFSAGMAGGVKNIVNTSVQYTAAFKEVHDFSQSVSSEFSMNFSNGSGGKQDSKGYIIYSQPTWDWNKYERQARNGRILDPSFLFAYVSGINVSYEEYDLTKPPDGMRKRPKSSDFQKWMATQTEFSEYISNANVKGQLNSIKASGTTAWQSSTLAIKTSDASQQTSSHKVKVDLKFGDKNIFLVSISAESAWETAIKRAVTIQKSVTASIKCKAEDKSIEVQPYWFRAPDAGDPPWLPKSHRGNKPWCITWRVLQYTPENPKFVEVTGDYNGDGITDLMFTNPRNTAGRDSSRTSAQGVFDRTSYGSIYLMSGNGRVLERLPVSGPDANLRLLDTIRLGNARFGLLLEDTESGEVYIRTQNGGDEQISGFALDSTHAYLDHGLFIGYTMIDGIATQDPATGSIDIHELDDDFSVKQVHRVFTPDEPGWQYCAEGDFDGNGASDLLLRNTDSCAFKMILLSMPDAAGAITSTMRNTLEYLPLPNGDEFFDTELEFASCGDFNGDGHADILLQTLDEPYTPVVALMSGSYVRRAGYIQSLPLFAGNVSPVAVSDYNRDGCADLLLQFNNLGKARTTLFTQFMLKGVTTGNSKFAVRVLSRRNLILGNQFNPVSELIMEDLD